MPHDYTPEERKGRYLNRELSSVAFNCRVLAEALNPANPLLERVRFLAISSSNLDEFTMVRIAGLKDQARHHVMEFSDDGMTPAQQLRALSEVMRDLLHQQQACWAGLRAELTAHGITVTTPEALNHAALRSLEAYFLENIFPALSPIAIDPAHPFPFLPNQGMAQLFTLKHEVTHVTMNAVLPLPQKIPRFYEVAGSGKGVHLVLLEAVMQRFAPLLFPGFEVTDSTLFRILRDSDLEVEEDAEDLLQNYEHAVKQRRRGRVIRVKAMKPASPKLVRLFLEYVETDIQQVHEMEEMLGLTCLQELCALPRPDLKYPPYHVRFPERITEYGGDCFAAIAAKDMIIHHPYESFDVVVQFLNQAAEDAQVVSIKQTLYRTSNDSPIVKALIRAAEAGKSVTALVELRARFDEEANIRWARDMERAGVQVVYGFVKLKTHAKISIVVRREQKKLVSYAHFGTGNYHPITAKIYTDLSFFTANPALAREAHYLFNYVTGYGVPASYQHLVPAPTHLRNRLLSLISAEAEHARAGQPSGIWMKMNALVDTEIIDALYAASWAGVPIDLVVRSICALRPQVAGLSENIRVKSVVGRFLEHARIYCFAAGHALPSSHAKVFIASADCMTRNLDWRVEVMVPLTNPTVHAQVLDQIMVANLKDDLNSWALLPDGTYEKIAPSEGFSAHRYFIENPSLSGRGKILNGTRKRGRSKKKGE
jgi:polyphosphate kinase